MGNTFLGREAPLDREAATLDVAQASQAVPNACANKSAAIQGRSGQMAQVRDTPEAEDLAAPHAPASTSPADDAPSPARLPTNARR